MWRGSIRLRLRHCGPGGRAADKIETDRPGGRGARRLREIRGVAALRPPRRCKQDDRNNSGSGRSTAGHNHRNRRRRKVFAGLLRGGKRSDFQGFFSRKGTRGGGATRRENRSDF